MIPIRIRIDHAPALAPFDSGFLLPDGRFALYVSDGGAFLLPVVQFEYDDLYAQDGPSTMIAFCDDDSKASVTRLYKRLKRLSAYELITSHYDEDSDAYLI